MLNPFQRRDNPYLLIVGMIGVKMGDRLVQVGCAHGGRLGAVAAKVGLSGHAIAIVPDEASAVRARKGAADAGVLVDVEIAPPTRLAAGDEAFDLAVVDDTGDLLDAMGPEDRLATIRELQRILRPGGRVMIVGSAPPSGLGALLTRSRSRVPFASAQATEVLRADGFKSVRTLTERDGLIFVEGIKPREVG